MLLCVPALCVCIHFVLPRDKRHWAPLPLHLTVLTLAVLQLITVGPWMLQQVIGNSPTGMLYIPILHLLFGLAMSPVMAIADLVRIDR